MLIFAENKIKSRFTFLHKILININELQFLNELGHPFRSFCITIELRILLIFAENQIIDLPIALHSTLHLLNSIFLLVYNLKKYLQNCVTIPGQTDIK